MGNLTSSPSTKLSYLYEQTTDIFVEQMYSEVAKASCDIQAFQNQRVVISDANLKNCKINISQFTNATCNLLAVFNSTMENQGAGLDAFIDKAVTTALNSQDPVMQKFLDIVNSNLPDGQTDAKTYIKNTIQVNKRISNFSSCSSNVFTVQNQNIFLNEVTCENGTVKIDQSAIITEYAKCFFNGALGALASTPNFRKIIRLFNGDLSATDDEVYGPLPDICYSALKPGTDNPDNPATPITPEIQSKVNCIPRYIAWFLIALLIIFIGGITIIRLKRKN